MKRVTPEIAPGHTPAHVWQPVEVYMPFTLLLFFVFCINIVVVLLQFILQHVLMIITCSYRIELVGSQYIMSNVK